MLTAETGAMIWLLLATYLELPVSTTHSIVGGIIGFALAFGGGSAVTWYERKADFPYVGKAICHSQSTVRKDELSLIPHTC